MQSNRLVDGYEDMFREITRKLYGDDLEQRTSSVQNEFETSVTSYESEAHSVNYKTEEDEDEADASMNNRPMDEATGNVSPDEAGHWHVADEPLKGTDGSRVASYRAFSSTWRCEECGEYIDGEAREMAEHFVENHSNRIEKDGEMFNNVQLEDLTDYLGKIVTVSSKYLKSRTEAAQASAVTLEAPVVHNNFIIAELPVVAASQILHQSEDLQQHQPTATSLLAVGSGAVKAAAANGSSNSDASANNKSEPSTRKKYMCPHCHYGTDRKDLFTRHEHIHRAEKPYHCYLCHKTFSRPDHVKKHFHRIHREHKYEVSRIRRDLSNSTSSASSVVSNSATATVTSPKANDNVNNAFSIMTSPSYSASNNNNTFLAVKSPTTTYQLQQLPLISSGQSTGNVIYRDATLNAAAAIVVASSTLVNNTNIVPAQQQAPQAEVAVQNAVVQAVKRLQNGRTSPKPPKSNSKKKTISCSYCSWIGTDNWCLKRHLKTHNRPYPCQICDYKAARAERLTSHTEKVHNKYQCSRCTFLAEEKDQLKLHQMQMHRIPLANVAASSNSVSSAPVQNDNDMLNVSNLSNVGEAHVVLNVAGAGRAPPGPPVFPASAATIVPATAALTSATILSFHHKLPEQRRSRKQSMPRKAIGYKSDNDDSNKENCD
ncbi:protein charlatan-like isoform X2 [Trichogramma pretiosum]|uniref:protein charlatan-like isoform X2 n=1 Tax=Trichogramma pretiosum TaxID=7493 RepID=UPI000C71B917|nr:protein charlatan-like isoform X2 [Trichogramma pretiosum]